MVRNFEKEKLLRILSDRAALIRNLVDPSPELLADCFNQNWKTTTFVPKEWLTLPVLIAYVKKLTQKAKSNSRYHDITIDGLFIFPVSVRDQIPESELRNLTKGHPHAIQSFPNGPHDLWVSYLYDDVWFQFKKIPEHHRTPDLLIKRLAVRAGHQDEIPDEVLTDTIVDAALELKPEDVLNHLPVQFQTMARLRRALELKSDLGLDSSLAKECWDAALAEAAIKADPDNIRHIPEFYITRDMALTSVKHSASNLQYVPKNIIDEDITVTAMVSGSLSYHTDVIPLKFLKSKAVLLKIAKLDAEYKLPEKLLGLRNYILLKGIDEPVWIEILKINPQAIRLIKKELQSDDIINTFLENASIDVIDDVYQHINLTRIKKEHAPLLVGTTRKLLQDLIQRKCIKQIRQPKKIAEEVKQVEVQTPTDPGSVTINLTDAEYLDIIKKYKDD